MDLRLVPASLLLLGSFLTAQNGGVTPTPTPEPAPEAKQDPDKPKVTPEQEAAQLTKERERLQKEISYVQDRAKNQKQLLAQRLVPHKPTFKSIDAGQPKSMIPPAITTPMQPRPAVVANEDQLHGHPNDTMLLVQGRPIARKTYDALMGYLAETPASGDEKMRAQRVLYDLIRIEAISAAFDENENLERLGDVNAQLDAGKPIGDLVKAFATVPGATPEGKVEVTRNSMFGPLFEHAAFKTGAGKRTHFRHPNGMVVLHVDNLEKGATPELDKVLAHAVLIAHNGDPEALMKAQQAVNMAQIEVLVADKATLDLLPDMWKAQALPDAVSPINGVVESRIPPEELKKAIDNIQAQIDTLTKSPDAEAKKRLPALTAQLEQMKAMFGKVVATDGVDAAPVKKDAPAPEAKKH
jgi:hypothetical protein